MNSPIDTAVPDVPSEKSPAAQPPRTRLAISVAGAAILLVLGRFPIPIFDLDLVRDTPYFKPETFSLVALSVQPFVSAALFIEFLALAIPSWRPLRIGGPEARAVLWRKVIKLGPLLAFVQGIGVARYTQSVHVHLLAPGIPALLFVAAVLTFGSCVLAWLAGVISRHGLGNGYAVLIVATGAAEFVDWLYEAQLGPTPQMGFVLAAVAIFLVMRRRSPFTDDAPEQLQLRRPASGLVPTAWVASLFAIHAFIAGRPVLRGIPLDGVEIAAILLVPTGALLAWLFNQPSRVAEVWSRLSGSEGREQVERRLSKLLPREAAISVVLLWGVLFFAYYAVIESHLDFYFKNALLVVFAMDLASEWRARSRHSLVSVWPIHRLYAVDAALLALARAGIPAHPRSVYFRSLQSFFAPHVPIEILVPEERAAEAAEVLQPLLIGPGEANIMKAAPSAAEGVSA